jgi:3-deoxy-D-arabino-heptulosonate 7-phosphate (DAHP) synthase
MQAQAKQDKKPRNGLAAVVAQQMSAEPAAPKAEKAKRENHTGKKLVWAKDFKPRTDNIVTQGSGKFAQQHNWDALCEAFDEAEDGEITYEQAIAAVLAAGKKGGYEATCNAKGFIAGRIRGEHITFA